MVKLVKLVTGEEIMGSIEKYENCELVIENPVRIAMTPQGLAMVPYCPFIKDKKVTIMHTHVNVIYLEEVDDDLANEYRSKFGSGIVTATAGLKI